jgi:hypothetical protein
MEAQVKRIETLDGMRGYFLFFMLINHMILQGGLWLQHINLAQVMFVEDAQGFVFLSGFLIGLIQTSRMMRYGMAAMRASIWRRAAELYVYAMGVVVIALTLRAVLPGGMAAYANWMGRAGPQDQLRDLALAMLVFQPTFMDILPMYVLFLLISPWLVRLGAEGRWPVVMTASVVVWMAAQIGAGNLIGGPLHAAFTASDGQGLRGSFNPLAWQIVFISGLVGGGLLARGGIEWKTIFAPDKTTLPIVCLIVVGFFLPVRIVTAHGLIDYEYLGPFQSMAIRRSFGPVYLLNLIGAGGLLAWLLIAGPEAKRRWVAALARGLHALFRFWPLKVMGRHSLQTYAWHVVLVYLLRYADWRWGPYGNWGTAALAGLLILLLPLPAVWREYRPWLRQKLLAPGAEAQG